MPDSYALGAPDRPLNRVRKGLGKWRQVMMLKHLECPWCYCLIAVDGKPYHMRICPVRAREIDPETDPEG